PMCAADILARVSSLALSPSLLVLPSLEELIFARVSALCVQPIRFCFPFRPSPILARCSALSARPFLPSDSFARVSALSVLPFDQRLIAARASGVRARLAAASLIFRRVSALCLRPDIPLCEALTFARVSSLCLTPRVEPAVGARFIPMLRSHAPSRSMYCCSSATNTAAGAYSRTSNENASSPYLRHALRSRALRCVPLRSVFLCSLHRSARRAELPT